jgi:hypothetical protein
MDHLYASSPVRRSLVLGVTSARTHLRGWELMVADPVACALAAVLAKQNLPLRVTVPSLRR